MILLSCIRTGPGSGSALIKFCGSAYNQCGSTSLTIEINIVFFISGGRNSNFLVLLSLLSKLPWLDILILPLVLFKNVIWNENINSNTFYIMYIVYIDNEITLLYKCTAALKFRLSTYYNRLYRSCNDDIFDNCLWYIIFSEMYWIYLQLPV